MSIARQTHHGERRSPAKALTGGLRRVYRAVVPREVREWRAKAQLFVLDRERYRRDAEAGRRFTEERLPQQDFFRRAFRLLALNGISGDYLEFGVSTGISFVYAYRYARRAEHPARLWAFDSFEGLPLSDDPRDSHPLWQAGKFAASRERFLDTCNTERIPRTRFEIVQGLYSDTLAPSSPGYDQLPRDIAFAYIDCDMYTSTKSVLDFLAPRLKQGMIIAFDDYFHLSRDAIAGDRLAFLELQKDVPQFHFLPYAQFKTCSASFIVENRSLLPI